jgi:hypothetical protein
MYRRPKFLEVLLEIRQQMAREADYDIDLFAEMVRSGTFPQPPGRPSLNDAARVRPATRSRKASQGKD